MYMASSWGGYVYIINIIPLYVILAVVCGMYSLRLWIAYSIFYVMGTVLSVQVREPTIINPKPQTLIHVMGTVLSVQVREPTIINPKPQSLIHAVGCIHLTYVLKPNLVGTRRHPRLASGLGFRAYRGMPKP
jgi:hypothetical protein